MPAQRAVGLHQVRDVLQRIVENQVSRQGLELERQRQIALVRRKQALGQALDTQFYPELRSAWLAIIEAVSLSMKNGAAELRRS